MIIRSVDSCDICCRFDEVECSTADDVLALAQLLKKCEDFKVAFHSITQRSQNVIVLRFPKMKIGDPTPPNLGG